MGNGGVKNQGFGNIFRLYDKGYSEEVDLIIRAITIALSFLININKEGQIVRS